VLLALRISNFAVIEEAEVGLGQGLTVLTGETGAGKSILVDALGLLLGGRADPEVIRSGCEDATVEGVFEKDGVLASRLEALGVPDLGDEVSVRRVVGRSGRGKVYVNGSLVAVGVLAKLFDGRVDVAGQHEHMSLFDPDRHVDILDRAGGLGEVLARYREDWASLREVDRKMAELGGDERQARERAEFLRFQVEEIDRLGPSEGEDKRLEEERRRLSGTERLRRAATEAEELLSSQDGAALDRLGRALGLLGEAVKIDAGLSSALERLASARAEIDEAVFALGRYLSHLESDPGRLAEVEDRVDALRRLCRKHGTDLAGVLARKAALSAELERLENRQGALAELAKERAGLEEVARKSAEALTQARVQAARRLERGVGEGLAQLAMPRACFEVRIEKVEALGDDGADRVELFFTANAGEPLRPLAKVASGGEASRLLLALRRALAGADAGGCCVLDEADAGVSGAVAEVVGRMIKEVSAHRQVLCITHLPQVAAYADAHLRIEKEERAGRTHSRIHPLGEGDRTKELARMLSGVEVTPEALGAAEALIRLARRATDAPAVRAKRQVPSPVKGAARLRRSA
jgi:DNA repair protein RecN (Recombination protein N)